MVDNLLTAQSVWKDFATESVTEEIIEENIKEGVVVKKIYLSGREVGVDSVKIYGIVVHPKKMTDLPGLLVFGEIGKPIEEALLIKLAKKGYCVFSPDFGGKSEEEYFTLYPEIISYANYTESKDKLLEVKESARKTCWYEWGCVAKHALKYLKQNHALVGALGIKKGAEVLWHLAGTESLDAVVFAFGTGWHTYKGKFKFANQDATTFDEVYYKYLAGFEPQSYAQYVKAPALILSATNNDSYDFERTYDTYIRLDHCGYKAINCSVGTGDVLDYGSYRDIEIFLAKNLKQTEDFLPKELDFEVEENNGKIKITVTPDEQGLKNIEVYKAENVLNPTLLGWTKIADLGKEKVYEYEIKNTVNKLFFMVKAEYENGFTLSSGVIAKDVTTNLIARRVNMLFSNVKKVNKFFAYVSEDDEFVNSSIITEDIKGMRIEKGPMAIKGVYSETGLISYSLNNEDAKFDEHSILMLDLYSKEDNEIEIELIVNYKKENQTSYFFKKEVQGSNIWRDFRIEGVRLKTLEGKPLQSFDNVNAIILRFKDKYVINNVMWI
ncbi:MAG: dienelactone hydrolase family protein [Clostridia bacterium]|nr:dienelactone hydrolase family protein [Clostridia bacterium]